MHTLSVDTICTLFGGKTGPRCEINYSLKYAEGNDADSLNRVITRCVFPENVDSSDIERAAHSEIKNIVDDYKVTLKGVTKKSIADGSFPAVYAEYKRVLNTNCKIVNKQLLVYTVSYTERAYGESDSLENLFTFNIGLKNISVAKTDDIFVPGYKDRLIGKIVNKMAKNYRVNDLSALQRKGIFSDGIPYATDNFIISEDNITFVYNPFEIAGRSYGIIKVTLEAEEIKDIMKKEWYAFFGIK